MAVTNVNAALIGSTLKQLRVNGGFRSRASLVDTKVLKGKLTPEGLRKIEAGERVPRIETLRKLADALGATASTRKHLERLALQTSIERATRRAGNVHVRFTISGQTMDVDRLPPKKKTESFVRKVVAELLEAALEKGLREEDEAAFRLQIRSILHRNLSTK